MLDMLSTEVMLLLFLMNLEEIELIFVLQHLVYMTFHVDVVDS